MKNTDVKQESIPLKPARHVERAAASMNKKKMQRLNVELPEDQHALLKSVAAAQKKLMREVVADLVAVYLNDHLKK